MKILIDNGHGIQTKGKCSPDGKLLEYAYTRELARQIVKILKSRGYDSEFLLSKACKQAIVDTHVEGIIEYLESL